MPRQTLPVIAVVLAVCACATSKPLKLRHVVLYQNGIGYFEHSGRASNDRLRLRVRNYEVNDLLKTLTVVAAGGDDLGATTINTAAQPEAGSDAGKKRGTKVAVEVHLSAQKSRQVTVAYAVPTAAWRPTYRIVLPEKRGEGRSLLQGWASIQNTSDEDWRNIRLTLATGAPLSFAIDLSTPEFVSRPNLAGQMIEPVATGAVSSSKGRPGDVDGDGIPDADDMCPVDPEDRDNFEDSDGCPDLDNDADGIADVDDMCPDSGENFNGMGDEDGCPDLGRVIVTESKIEILDKIYFEPGSATLMPASLSLLDAVAATLKDNPSILSVEIQGHAAANEKEIWTLSRLRAEAVRRALVARGLAAGRLEVRAYGETQPIDAADSESAPAKNRRVEFHILHRRDERARDSLDPAAPAPVSAANLHKSVSSSARAKDVAGAVQYRISKAVTIPHGETTLVPIVNRRVAGEEVYLYRPDSNAPGSSTHPFRAARLENDADLTLTPGPVAIFARGTFAGEGLLDHLYPDETAFVPYALDGSTVVGVSADNERAPDGIAAVRGGLVTIVDREIQTTTYEVRPGHSTPARIFVQHTQTPGYEVYALPPESERSGAVYLVPTPLAPNRTSFLRVKERRPQRRLVDLQDWRAADLAPYLEGAELDDGLRKSLVAIIALRAELRGLQTRYDVLEQQSFELARRTAELRADLRSLGAGAGKFKARLSRSLAESNRRYEKLARSLAELSSKRAELRIALADAVRGIPAAR